MQSKDGHQDNLLNIGSTGGVRSRQNQDSSLLKAGGRGMSQAMDKFEESLTLEKYSQAANGRLEKYNGDGSGLDKYMGIDKYGRETSCSSGLDKYRDRFRQDRCRYANELVGETKT